MGHNILRNENVGNLLKVFHVNMYIIMTSDEFESIKILEKILEFSYSGCSKSCDPNVRAYCSAGDGPVRIILPDMSCIFHSFEESIKWNINIVHFLMNFVHFRCFRASEDMGSHSFEVHCVWRLKVHLS